MPPPGPKSSPRAPFAPGTQDIGQAMRDSDVLASLHRRLQDSQRRLAALQVLLPLPMRAQVKAGPIDDDGWTLLAGNAAVAAKLRQMLPALEARLRHQGFEPRPLRVKLLPSSTR